MFRNGVLRFGLGGVLLLSLLEGCVASSDERTLDSTQGGSTAGAAPAQACGRPEVHVFGMYEARSDHGGGSHPTGEATVRVERTGPQVLVLSSYEPVRWKVSAVPNAQIQYILALGYYTQSVEAPPGVAVKMLGAPPQCGYEYPDDDPHSGCETPELLAQVKQLTGQDVSSFHGCYRATSFTLHDDLSVASSCPTGPGGDYNLSGFVSPFCSAHGSDGGQDGGPGNPGGPDGGQGHDGGQDGGQGDPNGQVCGNPEVNVFGTYEAGGDRSPGTHPTGETTVRVERTGSQVLVLSSYEPVRWKVSAVPGADLQYILALGYHAQSVEAPPGVEVKVLDYETKQFHASCAYEYPDDDPHSGCETPELLEQVKSLTGRDASSFHGCYRATSFTLHGDLSADSSCPTGPGGDYNLSGFVNSVCSGNGPHP